MAALSHSESRRKYSWWWDSHISPKNSKWLQENLTDMDAKVKSMIKLIEEDADSFARRAEMYYKQRPELMRLVEQFYRAYRALAERYNHATGELCHAHRAIARVFPEHLPPPELSDDCFPSRSLEHDPHTPGAKLSIRAIFEKNGDQADGLFPDSEGESRDFEVIIARGAEKEAQDLKKALYEMRAEKEDVLVKYQECMEKLSSMEVELDNAEKNAKRLEEKAGLAEIEVKTLKEGMVQLEVERNAGLIKHEQCLHKIADLEDLLAQAEEDKKGLDMRAVEAESEAQALKDEISRSWLEKEAVFRKCEEYLDKISALESIVSLTENEGSLLREKAENAENEVSRLKRALADLNRETEASALRYRCCRDTITKLEKELSSVKEHVERLNKDLSVKNVKLEKAEENHKFLEMSNFSLKIEAESLARKIASKDRELSEKQVELENFTVCLREENFRRVQIETTLQSLQNLHSQSQDDQRALKEELENVIRMLKDLEGNKGLLEEELLNIRDENQSLVEKNLSSAVAMGNMQNDIQGLREIKERLEKEVSNNIDLSNSLQTDIMSLKEEIKRLKESYWAVVEQVEAAGLTPSCLEASVRSLRDENSNLRQIREKGARENVTLSEKLLSEKVTCGNYALDMKAELESSRKEAKALQESCQLVEGEKAMLVAEKASLLSQLETVTETMHKLLEKNAVLEVSLSAAKVELEGLREKSKGLEEICELLKNERSFLLNERGALASKLGTVERRLKSMEKRYNGLEKKCVDLEKEKYAMQCQVEELMDSLSVEKQERASSKIQSETKLAGLKEKIQFLQEENIRKKKDFEDELEKSHKAHFEISILQKFMKDMDEKNSSLIIECQKHIKTSELTEKLISELEVESLEQQVDSEILLDEIERLRLGMLQIFRALETTSDFEGENERHLVDHILGNIEVLKSSITGHEDDKDLLLVQNSILLTFLEQLESKVVRIESQKIVLEGEIKTIAGNLEMARNEKEKVLDLNRKLKLDVLESKQHATVLESEINNLRKQADFHKDYVLLKKAYSQANKDKETLSKKLCDLEEEKIWLDLHNDTALIEYLAADKESVFLRSFCGEKISLLLEDLKRQQEINRGLEREMSLMTEKVQFQESEKFLLKDSVSNYAREMQEMNESYEQMKKDTVSIKESLLQTEAKLLDSEVKLQAAENLNLKLFATVDELEIDIQSSIRVKENLEKNVLELSERNMTQKSEIERLRAVQTNLETELGQLHEEIRENIIKEQILRSELQERNDEFELWESEATGFYFDLQISSVHEIFLVKKLQELAGVFRNLEDENTSKTSVIQEMKVEICSMENEISGLKSQLCAYGPMVAALREDVRVLENNACLQIKVKPSHNREPEEHPEAAFDPCKRASETPPEDDSLTSLRTLRTKIQTISKLMEQTNKPRLRRRPSTRKHREKSLSTDETETPPSQPIRCLGRNRPDPPKTHKLRTKKPCGTSTMKDIPLDRASNGLRSSWTHRAGDQMLELWEKPELTIGESLQLSSYKMMENGIIFNHGDSIQYNINKPELHLTDSDLDKELRVDVLGLRRKSTENERRILERLLSDGARLENLWTTLGILREKVEETEKKGWKSKKVDPEMVWEQLAEAEDMVEYLGELNGQLVRNIESFRLSVRKSSPKAREAVRMRRRKVGEQAKRGSERIGRLQLELQKIQYILLRMEEERSNGKGRGVFFRSKSFVLRDFIRKRNGGKLQKKKKGQLCGCFGPPRSGNVQS